MKSVKLGQLTRITIGRTPSRSDDSLWDKNRESANIWLSIADLLSTEGKVVVDSKEYITDKAAKSFAMVPKGTLLVSFKLTLGRLAYAGCNLRTNEAIAALHNDQTRITNEYLYYYLTHFDWNEYAKADNKVKGLTLNKAKLAEITITYPESIEEQLRIVSRLDTAFHKISRAEALLRQNLDSVSTLQKSILHSSLRTTGVVHRLSDLGPIQTGTTPKTSVKTYYGDDIPFIKPSDFLENGRLNMNGQKLSNAGLSVGRLIKENSVLMVCIGTIGKVAYSDISISCNQQINTITLGSLTEAKYLYYLMTSDEFQAKVKHSTNQMTLPIINKTAWSNLLVQIPDLSDQRRIVAVLDDTFDKTRRVKAKYMDKLSKLVALRQSLLQQAFSTSDKV